MKCRNCQFENPQGMNFCGHCGISLEAVCPNCTASNPSNFTFCGACGHSLTSPAGAPSPKDLSFDEKLSKIQRYLPKGLTEKILAHRDKIEGERKHVTVMFCDMVGFTPLVEKLGPENAYALMDQVQEILIHKVHEYEGTVNQLTGDGLMALFGAPIALEDAPQRAIRSSLAIHREMTRFSEKMREESGFPAVKMRIGINTGPVVEGTVGNDLRVEFTAVGDTVNTASRMEGLAEPGTTYVAGETFKLTEGFFRFEALGEKEVKGKEVPVKVYQVIAPSTRRTRFDVNAERGLTRFVGRERELELLLDGFERAKAGRGQAFAIVGEAGVGKSRLLYEFRKAVSNEDVTFLEGKCLSYSRGLAYHPIIDILKANFRIHEQDEDLEIREKVTRGLEALGIDEASILPYVLELLSVKGSGIDKIQMSPEGKRERIIESIKRMVVKGSEIRQLVIAIEDLHWIDESSEEVLKHLLGSIPGARVVLIFTYRLEFMPKWGGKSYYIQLNLNRFSEGDSHLMVTHMLHTEKFARDLEQLILKQTEGIPLFIEEFVKALVELKIIEKIDGRYHLAKDVGEMTVPSTIQEIIMARIDSLPEGARNVLQTGSVIEREFSYELIRRVTGLLERDLLSHMSVLKDSELIYERGIFPHSIYIFNHALTREAVYDSMLTNHKKRLHEQIALAIEELYEEDLDQHYGVLTEHYIAGENYQLGGHYAGLAYKKAAKTGSLKDAIFYCRKQIACLEGVPWHDDLHKKMIDVRTDLGLYMSHLNYISGAKDAIEPVIELALKSDYKRKLSPIFTIMGTYKCWVEEDFPEAFRYFQKALLIAQETQDIVSLAFASYWWGFVLSLNCEFDKVLQHFETALRINVSANYLWGISVMKSVTNVFWDHWQGRLDSGYQTSHDAITIADKSGDIFSKSWAYMSHGISLYGKGFLEESKEHLLKGSDFCQKADLFVIDALAHFFLGEVCLELGEYQESQSYYETAVILLENNKALPSWISLAKIGAARSRFTRHDKQLGLECLYASVRDNRIKLLDGLIRRHMAEILACIGDAYLSEAEDWIVQAVEADTRNGLRFYLAMDYLSYAKLAGLRGNRTLAREKLAEAIEIFAECGAAGRLNKAREELTALANNLP